MKYISFFMVLIYAFTASAQDIRARRINVFMSAVFAGLGIVLCVVMHRELSDIGLALVPGICMAALSAVTGGGIGMGDAVFAGTCAMYVSAQKLLISAAIAWGSCGITALFLIIGMQIGLVRRRNRAAQTGLPFTVFMSMPIAVFAAQQVL